MTPLLEIKHLIKKYKAVTAVNDINFSIQAGICFGLLGPNGAGKTTALEVIEGIIEATAGDILYQGAPRSASFKEEIGIQFQHTALLDFLTVRETLATFQSMYQEVDSIENLAEICNLHDIMNHRNNKISGGQTQRLLLALALINRPKLLFLDEPSTGLDPQARRNLWNIVQTVKESGKTIILTTHSMEEAEILCDEIAIMDCGSIIAQGAPAMLIQQHCSGGTISLPRQAIGMKLEHLPFTFHSNQEQIQIQTDNIHAALEILLAMKIDFSEMKVRSPNLEDVFLNLTGKKLRD